MGENSEISWTDHTFNPWIGCTKVSPGCANCYAAAQDKFRSWTPEGWGKGKPRKLTSGTNWGKPIRWNREAEDSGVRRRVFCASLADVFDEEVEDNWRSMLFSLIMVTPDLDWLLLTKRPANALRFMTQEIEAHAFKNVWLGVSVENQQAADERIPILLQIPAAVRFLSCEPLLGPVDVSMHLTDPLHCCWHCGTEIVRGHGNTFEDERALLGTCVRCECDLTSRHAIDWVIAGGESGPKARPSHPDWFRSLRDQCQAAGVAFHFKQWGEFAPSPDGGLPDDLPDSAGFYFDAPHPPGKTWRFGKKAAGRVLDGRTWDEFPEVPR